MGKRPDIVPRKKPKPYEKRRTQAELARDKVLRETEASVARIQAAKAQREEMILQQQLGLAIPIERAEAVVKDVVRRFVQALTGLGAELAPVLAGMETSEIHEKIDATLREVLQQFSNATAALSQGTGKRRPGRPRKGDMVA